MREFDGYLQGLTKDKRTVSTSERKARLLRDGFGKKPAFRCIIAREDTKPIGYLCYHEGYDPDEMRGKVIYVIDLFVTSSARGSGIGRMLMDRVADVCANMDGIAVYVGVWRRNPKAIKFYMGIGAEFVEDVPFMRWGKERWL